ncbi:hypothetical protein HORIV_10380 [Vreelandella olivaria]|uniref:Uncharacterized protein n=1 Tax=Vreelandella olivaria TaxID=390919 RepID=A0ABM7GD65_9GAMM|nr:hypothetical protein HORIV_10380 [Halomonas olivaria]
MPRVINKMVTLIPSPLRLQRRTDTFDESGYCIDLANVEGKRDGFTPYAFNFSYNGVCALNATAIGEDNIAAMAGNIDSSVTAKSAAATGNN